MVKDDFFLDMIFFQVSMIKTTSFSKSKLLFPGNDKSLGEKDEKLSR